jgi:DNA-nicking Smr family endonuclease
MLNDFLDAMTGVRPLEKTECVELKKKTVDTETTAVRRLAAEYFSSPNHHLPNGDSTTADLVGRQATIEPVTPLGVLSFQRPGVQHSVFKRLRLGRCAIEACLDLHGMTVEQARVAVIEFVRDCLLRDIRCALINHGKGEGRQQPAVLKSCVAHWLPQLAEVLAFHSAQNNQGGVGATYIMLKKSDAKRQERFE